MWLMRYSMKENVDESVIYKDILGNYGQMISVVLFDLFNDADEEQNWMISRGFIKYIYSRSCALPDCSIGRIILIVALISRYN